MKITDRSQSFRQPEVESKVVKYEGPKTLKETYGLEIPQEVVDRFEDAQQRAAEGDGLFGVLDALSDKLNESRAPRISSPVSKYNGPDSLEVKKPISEVEKYKGPKSLVEAEPSDSTDYLDNINIPDELLDQLNRARNNPPDLFPQLTRLLRDQQTESSEPKIESKANQYKGPKYIGGR
jgi:hypothetical protein